jgi:hypothetical protein
MRFGKREDGHGEVLPGNARARSRSRSRQRRGYRAPTKLMALRMALSCAACWGRGIGSDEHACSACGRVF